MACSRPVGRGSLNGYRVLNSSAVVGVLLVQLLEFFRVLSAASSWVLQLQLTAPAFVRGSTDRIVWTSSERDGARLTALDVETGLVIDSSA